MERTIPSIHARSTDRELVPRAMARAMLILCLSVLALVTVARVTDRPVSSTPPEGEIAYERTVLLSGDLSGAAVVRAPDGTLLAELSPETGGFIAGVERVIRRERVKNRVPLDGPVKLIRYDSGRISIFDPSTGWGADLMGFGADNARAFGRLLAQ